MENLLECPFCGGAASFEEVGRQDEPGGVRWTVGCNEPIANEEKTGGFVVLCYGYQSLTTFATKREAAMAWNRRAPMKPVELPPIDNAYVAPGCEKFPIT